MNQPSSIARLLKPTEYGLSSKFKDYFPGQAEAIESIEAQFEDKKRVVFCDAPTGGGKSLLATVIAKRLDNPDPTALVVVQTKILQQQYCHSADTEVFTDQGFIQFPKLLELNPKPRLATINPLSHQLEFQSPEECQQFDFNGPLMKIWGRKAGFSALVTPSHRMYIRWRKAPELRGERRDWFFKEALHLPSGYFRVLTAPKPQASSSGLGCFVLPSSSGKHSWHDALIIPALDFFEFLGYYISEGCLIHTSRNYRVDISQNPGWKADLIEACLARLPLHLQRTTVGGGSDCLRWQIDHKGLWTYLFENVGHRAKDKRIPRDLLTVASNEELRCLLNALLIGDGSGYMHKQYPSVGYATISKALADGVQEVALRLGYSSTASAPSQKKNCYRTSIMKRRERMICNREFKDYSGKVYCATVPNGILITRRNGRIAISGNSKDFPFYALVKGRNNFKCALQTELRADEGLCRLETFMCEEKDSICPYFLQKAKAVASNMVVTNASFFLHEANYAGGLVCSQRNFLIVDEGHLLENSLMDFVAVQLPEHSLRLVDIDLPKLDSPEGAKTWAAEIWPILEREHSTLERSCVSKGDSVDADSIRRLLRFRRMTARLKTLSAIEPKKWFLAEQHKGYILRPFLIDDFVRPLVTRHAAKTLLMSATFLNPRVMANLLGLDRDTVGWHQMDSNFPPERRPYNFVPIVKLSRRTGPIGYERLTAAIDQILERHSEEKGIVHTASFKVMNEILKRTKYPQRFISHRPSSTRDTTKGHSRDEAIQRFLTTSRPLALISPSMGLGLDLKDDLARWTIIAKINFLNLGDPQIRYRQRLDPEWYSWSAVASTIQATGRIVRHSLDWGTSYVLDTNLYILLKKYPYLFPKWWKRAFHKVDSIEQAIIAVH